MAFSYPLFSRILSKTLRDPNKKVVYRQKNSFLHILQALKGYWRILRNEIAVKPENGKGGF